VLEFIDQMWKGEGYGELRAFKGEQRKQVFFDRREKNSTNLVAQSAILLDSDGFEVFYGVALRSEKDGKAASVPSLSALWLDLDAKERTRAEVMRGLWAISPAPQIVVDSGRGFHAYFLLREPETDFELTEAIMRGMAEQTGGDHVHDRGRVLRLPGTHNHKQDPPIPVRLLRYEVERRHSISDFKEYAVVRPKPRLREGTLPRRPLPAWLLTKLAENPGKGKRSEHLFGCVANLLEHGWPSDDILSVLAAYPHGAGEKAAEKGEEWTIKYVIAPAARSVGL
jgi:hypothetical protein